MIDLGKEVVKTFKNKIEPNLKEYLQNLNKILNDGRFYSATKPGTSKKEISDKFNPSTYKIFRNIVSSSGNREKFATNVVNFLKKYNLDGVDR